eukprot:TRINITY_DN28265_c0_g1_i2.p1 TRINITY_DN28265_c0_g1~~TRINITY_DN28265_c0_g1_i2.p1  ORF type:complete len:345 (+),score=48.31 TRINITY_DN28265_c0_g1_i2:672-1706(+)
MAPSIPRKAEPIGWDDSAFQSWDAMLVWPPLGVPCVPFLGKYGPDYTPALPFVVVKLPSGCLKDPTFPAALRDALQPSDIGESSNNGASHGSASTPPLLFLLVHPALPLDSQPCQKFTCDRTDEVNLVLHAWALPDLLGLEEVADVIPEVGIFLPESAAAAGVSPAHLDIEELRPAGAESSAGVPFNRLGRRQVLVHHGCLSPDNLQFRVDPSRRLVGFFSAARLGSCRVACFHMLPINESAEDQLRRVVKNSADVKALREALLTASCSLGAEELGRISASMLDQMPMEATCAAPWVASAVCGGDAMKKLWPVERTGGASSSSAKPAPVQSEYDEDIWDMLKGG